MTSSMDLVLVNELVADIKQQLKRAGRVLLSQSQQLRDVTADRDEWREQHENLLAIKQELDIEVAALREQAKIDKDFIEQYQRDLDGKDQ